MSELITDLNDLSHEVRDLLESNDNFVRLSDEEKLLAMNLVLANDPKLVDSLWQVNYRFRPPSMDEFLSNAYYLGGTVEYIYPCWRKVLGEVYAPESFVNEQVFSGSIGCGKSTAGLISLLYSLIKMTALRHPQKFYKMPTMSQIYIAMFTLSREKAGQALVSPFLKLVADSAHFEHVRKKEYFNDFIESNPGRVPYVNHGGVLEFPHGIHVVSGSNELHAISLNILAGLLDESEFFQGNNKGDDSVRSSMSLYTAVRERIRSRFLGRPGYMMHLISSKRFENSPTEKYINEVAKKDKTTKVVELAIWDAKDPSIYSGNKFKLFVGGKGHEPRILNPDEYESFQPPPQTKVIDVPVEYHQDFKLKIYDSIRNLAGIATSSISPFFPSTEVVDSLFDPHLVNVTKKMTTTMKDDHCISIDVFNTPIFVNLGGKISIVRAPNAPRFIHVDLAEASDSVGIAMCHKEIKRDGSTVIVYDFAFPIKPPAEKINLNAIFQFIIDLKEIVGIRIKYASADRYQSSAGIGKLKQKNIEAGFLSMDRSTEPYTLFRSAMISNKLKTGHHDIIRKECFDLQDLGDKIDHVPVSSDGTPGSKDVTDCMAGSHLACSMDTELPTYIYEDLNEAFDRARARQQAQVPSKAGDKFGDLLSRHKLSPTATKRRDP